MQIPPQNQIPPTPAVPTPKPATPGVAPAKPVATQAQIPPAENLALQNTAKPTASTSVPLFEGLAQMVDEAAKHLQRVEHPRARAHILEQLSQAFKEVKSVGSGIQLYSHDCSELRSLQQHIDNEVKWIRQDPKGRNPHPSAQDPQLLEAYHEILKTLQSAMAHQQMKPLPNIEPNPYRLSAGYSLRDQ